MLAGPTARRAPWITSWPSGSKRTLKRSHGKASVGLSAQIGYGTRTLGAGEVVYLQTRKPSGTWKSKYRLVTDKHGWVGKRLSFANRGTTKVRWYAPSQGIYTSATSAELTIKVK